MKHAEKCSGAAAIWDRFMHFLQSLQNPNYFDPFLNVGIGIFMDNLKTTNYNFSFGH